MSKCVNLSPVCSFQKPKMCFIQKIHQEWIIKVNLNTAWRGSVWMGEETVYFSEMITYNCEVIQTSAANSRRQKAQAEPCVGTLKALRGLVGDNLKIQVYVWQTLSLCLCNFFWLSIGIAI